MKQSKLQSSKKQFYIILTISILAGALIIGSSICALSPSCPFTGANVKTKSESVTDINAYEAKLLIEENRDNPEFVILDIRTPAEYGEGHIEGAVNLDFYEQSFKDDLGKLDKNKTYLLHCRSGSRSGNTVPVLKNLGFTDIQHLNKGFDEWSSVGYETVSE